MLVRPRSLTVAALTEQTKEFDLSNFNEEMKTFDRRPLKDPDQFERACFFASDIGNGVYFWDPTLPTHTDENEYAIFVMYEDYEIHGLADTFWDFINEICLKPCPPAYLRGEIELTFEPHE